jgi:hypothetical protein
VLCAIPLILGLVASVRRITTPDPWVKVEALCDRRDIQPVQGDDDNGSYPYTYRLLCRFEYDGLTYEVTPEGTAEPEPRLFESPEAASAFLEQRLSTGGLTELWINVRNPLEANLTGARRHPKHVATRDRR